jgi:hypothetical protein
VEVLPRRIDIVIGHVLGTITAGRHRTTVGSLEKPSIAVVFLDAEATLVHQSVGTSLWLEWSCKYIQFLFLKQRKSKNF